MVACRMNNRSSASAATGSIAYGSHGTAKNMFSMFRAVAQIIARIHEGLAERVLVRRRRDRGQLRDDPVREDLPVARVVDVGRVLVKGRHGRDHGRYHGHRVGIVVKAPKEAQQLLVDHRVTRDRVGEPRELRLVRSSPWINR